MLPQALLLALVVAVSARQIHNAHPGFVNNDHIQACVAVKDNVDGAAVTLQNCGANGDQAVYEWDLSFFSDSSAQTTLQQIKVFGDKCLEVKDGSSVQIGVCDGSNANPNQQWTSSSDSTFRWGGKPNQCLDLRDGKTVNGTPLVVQPCSLASWLPTQTWASYPITRKLDEGRLYTGGNSAEDSYCITASSEDVNAPIGLAKCNSFKDVYPKGSNAWYIPSLGFTNRISSRLEQPKCLTVPGDKKENGVKLAIGPCVRGTGPPTSQRFIALATGQLQLEGTRFCVDVADLQITNGALIQLWECIGDRPSQKWSRAAV
ncbi:Ricin B-like lectin [Mycena indigotica]|uniref:Ricin B-like lectin n=1 Tax=Mycena indigotica TaxID=2126181 RepID=A0A8H6W6U2_9AGAR|nr:Ricin B-like lectin [Mycena indigotica]KAF7301449.1 Ricin B-like lectin [Mycena indigotica]